MLNITILSVGAIKEKYWQEAINEYLKRLTPFVKVEVIELKDEGIKKESEKILSYLDSNTFVMDEKGKELTSVEFARSIEKKMIKGLKNLIFVIGGAYGISDKIKNHEKISLSKLTFSHQLVRLVFAEQLYRAMTILKGEPYHHE